MGCRKFGRPLIAIRYSLFGSKAAIERVGTFDYAIDPLRGSDCSAQDDIVGGMAGSQVSSQSPQHAKTARAPAGLQKSKVRLQK